VGWFIVWSRCKRRGRNTEIQDRKSRLAKTASVRKWRL